MRAILIFFYDSVQPNGAFLLARIPANKSCRLASGSPWLRTRDIRRGHGAIVFARATGLAVRQMHPGNGNELAERASFSADRTAPSGGPRPHKTRFRALVVRRRQKKKSSSREAIEMYDEGGCLACVVYFPRSVFSRARWARERGGGHMSAPEQAHKAREKDGHRALRAAEVMINNPASE